MAAQAHGTAAARAGDFRGSDVDHGRGKSHSAPHSLTLHCARRLSTSMKALYSVVAAIIFIALCHRALSKPRSRNLFPVWATIELALTSYIITNGGFSRRVLSLIRRYRGALFGVTSGHQVLVNFSGVDRLLSQPHHTVNAKPAQYTLLVRVFGGTDTPDIERKLDTSWRDLVPPIERLFMNETAAAAAIVKADVPGKAASFVTFSRNRGEMKRWELSADVEVVVPDLPGEPGSVVASFQSLVRDFGACISIPLLYGQDFLDRHPHLLDDLWKFDNDLFPLLMIGVPEWAPFKVMREGLAARSRLITAMIDLYRRIDQYQSGKPVDFGADMSDVSSTALGRNKVFARDGFPIEYRGEVDFSIFWGQNANTHPALFWLLIYVYSTPGILERLRDELSPHFKFSGLDHPHILSMDLAAVTRDCPLLKACIYETYRMAVEATSIRYIEKPISIEDGEYKHELKGGMFISAPHALIQRDPAVYSDPDKFIPDRFLATDAATGKVVARYGRLHPWGSGASICKGRTFAEKELLSASACIISLWEVAPASGTWEIPAQRPGTGVMKPATDIRVVIKRRVLH